MIQFDIQQQYINSLRLYNHRIPIKMPQCLAPTKQRIKIVSAISSGMLGGFVFSLPVFSYNAGYYYNIIIIIITGLANYYSCYLYIQHTGGQLDTDRSLSIHFGDTKLGSRISKIYNGIVIINLMMILISYYNIICQQVFQIVAIFIPTITTQGFNFHTKQTIFFCTTIGWAVFLLLFATVLNKIHYGVKILSIGLVTVFAYCIVLIYLTIDSADDQPNNGNVFPSLWGEGNYFNIFYLLVYLNLAFTTQTFFIPILDEAKPQQKNQANSKMLTGWAYVIGGCSYTLISYLGGDVIKNYARVSGKPIDQLQQISLIAFMAGDGQQNSNYQIYSTIMAVLYIFHIFFAFSQFLLICRKRVFKLFRESLKWKFIKQNLDFEWMNYQQVLFTVGILLVSVGVFFADTICKSLGLSFTLSIINGSVLAFFYVCLVPTLIHIKCVFYHDRSNSDSIQISSSSSNRNSIKNMMQKQKKQVGRQLSDFGTPMIKSRSSSRNRRQGEDESEWTTEEDKQQQIPKHECLNRTQQKDERWNTLFIVLLNTEGIVSAVFGIVMIVRYYMDYSPQCYIHSET